MSDGGTEKAKHRRGVEIPVQVRRVSLQENPQWRGRAASLKHDGEPFGAQTG